MQNFDDIKVSLQDCVSQLIGNIDVILVGIQEIYNGNLILRYHLSENEIENIRTLVKGLKINSAMLSRAKMKCAFFGKTSNGKSAVINAMLHEEVLPSCCGRTTSCFITVEGCLDEEGYFLDKEGSKIPIACLEDVASEYDETSYGIESQIQLFWPIFRCNMLQYEVLLLDSPGCDVSVDKDSWIEKYCLDADVFIYVVDSSSTLCQSEREFFRKVKHQIGNPNLFVLLNKWDLCRSNCNEAATKQQHINTIREFLRDDMLSQCDPESRLYFVSATENLSEYTTEFQRFVDNLTSEMSQRAVVTKCKQHSDKGNESIPIVINFLDRLLLFKRTEDGDYIRAKDNIDILMEMTFENIETYSIRYLQGKCHNYTSTISSNIQQRKVTLDGISTFIECHFMQIFNNLQTKVEAMLPGITEYMTSSANVNVDQHIMANYIPNSFKELTSQYKEDFQKKKINSEITNAFNELDSYLRPTCSGEVTRYTNNNFFDYGIFGIRSLFGGIYDTISSIVTTAQKVFTGSNRQTELEASLANKISEYLTDTAKKIIKDCKDDINDRLSIMINIFIEDCDELSRLLDNLGNIRQLLESISEDLIFVQARIDSMDE